MSVFGQFIRGQWGGWGQASIHYGKKLKNAPKILQLKLQEQHHLIT